MCLKIKNPSKWLSNAPRAKIAKILREIQALPAQILRERDAKRTTFSTPNTPPTRSSTAPTSCGCRRDAVRSLGAPNIKNATDLQVVCNRSANFRTEKCARTRRRARDFATPNAAPIQATALPTSDVSRSARSVNKMHVERAARRNRENFARNSNVADANFARVRRQTHNFFDTKHAIDPIKHSANVASLSQRHRPKFGCAQHQKRNRFAGCLQPIRKFSNG